MSGTYPGREGLFLVDRGIFDHPAFNPDEPFSEREAFLWMVAEAAFKPRSVRTKRSGIIAIERGQLTAATRFMATRFRWSEARVRRFVQRLTDTQTIDANSDAGQMIITICNYDQYQDFRRYRDAVGDAQSSAVGDADSDAVASAQPDAQATRYRRGTDAVATQTRTPSTPDIYTHNSDTRAQAEAVPEAEIMPFERSPQEVAKAKPEPPDETLVIPKHMRRVTRETTIKNVGLVKFVGKDNADAMVTAWEAAGASLVEINDLAMEALTFGGGTKDWLITEIGKLTGAQSDDGISDTTLDAFPELRSSIS